MRRFHENQLSPVTKFSIYLLFIVAYCAVIYNIINLNPVNPNAFMIVLIGFLFFLISKISLIRNGIIISFGTGKMSNMMGNFYRLGYWVMAVGVLLTFLP